MGAVQLHLLKDYFEVLGKVDGDLRCLQMKHQDVQVVVGEVVSVFDHLPDELSHVVECALKELVSLDSVGQLLELNR